MRGSVFRKVQLRALVSLAEGNPDRFAGVSAAYDDDGVMNLRAAYTHHRNAVPAGDRWVALLGVARYFGQSRLCAEYFEPGQAAATTVRTAMIGGNLWFGDTERFPDRLRMGPTRLAVSYAWQRDGAAKARRFAAYWWHWLSQRTGVQVGFAVIDNKRLRGGDGEPGVPAGRERRQADRDPDRLAQQLLTPARARDGAPTARGAGRRAIRLLSRWV